MRRRSFEISFDITPLKHTEAALQASLKDKDALLAAIPLYDGLAIRSASKVTPKIIAAATNLKVIGRAGIGVGAPAGR